MWSQESSEPSLFQDMRIFGKTCSEYSFAANTGDGVVLWWVALLCKYEDGMIILPALKRKMNGRGKYCREINKKYTHINYFQNWAIIFLKISTFGFTVTISTPALEIGP